MTDEEKMNKWLDFSNERHIKKEGGLATFSIIEEVIDGKVKNLSIVLGEGKNVIDIIVSVSMHQSLIGDIILNAAHEIAAIRANIPKN